jgi:hypothetical protein
MSAAFVKFGHGYEEGSRGRCDAFDGFTILAAPLHQEGEGWKSAFGDKARESRVFYHKDGATCYGSHAIKLAENRFKDLYILMHHGAGREVLSVPRFYDGGDLRAAILAMPERLQYALLYTIWQTASNARTEAQAETRATWAKAVHEKRIRKRKRGGTVRIEIIPEWEIAMKEKSAA